MNKKKLFMNYTNIHLDTFCYGQGTFSTAPVEMLQTDLIFIVTKCR